MLHQEKRPAEERRTKNFQSRSRDSRVTLISRRGSCLCGDEYGEGSVAGPNRKMMMMPTTMMMMMMMMMIVYTKTSFCFCQNLFRCFNSLELRKLTLKYRLVIANRSQEHRSANDFIIRKAR